MLDEVVAPEALAAILAATERIGFAMASEPLTGALLRALAASKPGGRLLEIGTGTGAGTVWLLDGMDQAARLTSIDRDERAMQVALDHLGADPRVSFIAGDAGTLLATLPEAAYDMIFADTMPGKFTHLDEALRLLRPGGLYVIDDLLPQPNWPEDHGPKVEQLVARLRARPDLVLASLRWASGIIVATRVGAGS
jgi:predicted O-methyltransferase YrrM